MSDLPRKILLATDGSEEADLAAKAAADLAAEAGSELHVVSVGPGYPLYMLPDSTGRFQEIFEEEKRGTREVLDAQVRKVEAAGGRVEKAHQRSGRPDREILDLAADLDADMVVIGSRGFGPLKRAVMGSVSLGVVRHAHCSVLVVRGDGEDVLSGPILVGTDGSREADEAANAGVEISAATGADLHVVHTLDPKAYMPYTGPEVWEGWQADLARAERGARSWVASQAEQLRERGGAKTVEAHLALGDPDREIVRLAEELGAGLVIVGSRGLGGVRRMLLGGVSDSVVRHAHRSVMVVRAGEPGGE